MRVQWFRRGAAVRAMTAAAAFLLLAVVSTARAGDVESAKEKVTRAKDDIARERWDEFDQDLKSAETFLDGVPDADRAPVAAQVAALRAQAAPQIKAYRSQRVENDINDAIKNAVREVERDAYAAGVHLQAAADRLASDDAKSLDPVKAKALQTRIDGLRQTANATAKKRALAMADAPYKELVQRTATDPFKGMSADKVETVSRDLNTLMSRVRGAVDTLPKDDKDVVAMTAKMAAVSKQIDAAAGASERNDAVDRLRKSWANTKEYFAGWDKETQGPTWEDYTHKQGGDMSYLLMPKTIEAISRVKGWLKDGQLKEAQDKYQGDPDVQAIADEATKTLNAAADKLHANFSKVMDGAEQAPMPADAVDRLKPQFLGDSAKNWFDGTKYADADPARAKAVSQKWLGAVNDASKAGEALFKKMNAQAAAAWPGIVGALKTTDGFSPNKLDAFKGKTVRVKSRNRMGWDYTSDSFPFATAVDGLPVAGKFDANVKAAWDAVREKTRGFSNEEEEWDVVGVVEDGKGRIAERTSTNVTDGSSGRTVGTLHDERPVDVPVIRIIALHAGPVAVGPSGAVTDSGAVQPTGAASSATGGTAAAAIGTGVGILSWLFRIVWLLIALAAAALVILKARPQAIAQPATVKPAAPGTSAGTLNYASPLPAALAGDNLGYAGLVIALLGLLQLLAGCVVGDLLPAVALIAAGVYIASDFLRGRGMLKDPMYNQLKPLGVPIAAATALFAVLHVFLGHWWLF